MNRSVVVLVFALFSQIVPAIQASRLRMMATAQEGAAAHQAAIAHLHKGAAELARALRRSLDQPDVPPELLAEAMRERFRLAAAEMGQEGEPPELLSSFANDAPDAVFVPRSLMANAFAAPPEDFTDLDGMGMVSAPGELGSTEPIPMGGAIVIVEGGNQEMPDAVVQELVNGPVPPVLKEMPDAVGREFVAERVPDFVNEPVPPVLKEAQNVTTKDEVKVAVKNLAKEMKNIEQSIGTSGLQKVIQEFFAASAQAPSEAARLPQAPQAATEPHKLSKSKGSMAVHIVESPNATARMPANRPMAVHIVESPNATARMPAKTPASTVEHKATNTPSGATASHIVAGRKAAEAKVSK